jgi:hypothetical protein
MYGEIDKVQPDTIEGIRKALEKAIQDGLDASPGDWYAEESPIGEIEFRPSNLFLELQEESTGEIHTAQFEVRLVRVE